MTSILLNIDRDIFQEDETKDAGNKILSYLFYVADLLKASYSSCAWNVIFEVVYLNQNGVLGLQITDTNNYCKYQNKVSDFMINSSGIWLDSLLVSQLREHGVQKLYLIVLSCDSFFYNGELLTNNNQVFGLYIPNIDDTFNNQVTVIFDSFVFTPNTAGCVTWEDVSTKYVEKGRWGLQKQLNSNGGCEWFQQGWFSVKLIDEPFNITKSLQNLDDSLPTSEKLKQLEAITTYSEDFKPQDVYFLLKKLLNCQDLSMGDLSILKRISANFCDIPNNVKRDAERLFHTNHMILKIVSIVGSIIETNTAYTIGNILQIISCNLNQNKELYLARNFISCQPLSENDYSTNLIYYGNTKTAEQVMLFSVIAFQSNDLFDEQYDTSQILGISTLVTSETSITRFKITFKHDQYNDPSYSCACWNNHKWTYFHTLQSKYNTSCYINDLQYCEYVTLANLDINKILNDVYSKDDEQDSKCDESSYCTTTLQVTLNALNNHFSELEASSIDTVFNIFNKINLDTEQQLEYMADIIDLLMNLDREILAKAQTHNNSTEKLHECINRLVKDYKDEYEYFIKDVISNEAQVDSCHTALLINNTYQSKVGTSEYYTIVTVYFNDALFIGEYNTVDEKNGIIVGVAVSDDNLQLSMSMSFENYKNNTNCVYWKHKALDSKTETGYWAPISKCPCASTEGTYFALLESHNVTNDLEQVFNSNVSIDEQLQRVISILDIHNQNLEAFDVHLVASILGKLLNESTVTTQHMDFSSAIISKLYLVNTNVLQQSQEKYGATDNILYTLDETTQLCNDTFSSGILYNNFLLTKINVQNSNITGVILNKCTESLCNITPLYSNQTIEESADKNSFKTALLFSEALQKQIDENIDPVNLIVSVHFSSQLFREQQQRSLSTSKILGIILEGINEKLAGSIYLIHNKDNIEKTANSSCAYWKYQMGHFKKECTKLNFKINKHFEIFMNEAVAEAEKSDVEQTFPLLRQRKTKLQFSYEGTDETVFDPKQKFKISFYFQILDTIQSLQRRFGGIDKLHDLFGFLGNFQNLDSDVIKRSCMDLDLALQIQHAGNVCKDIDGLDLHNEILSYKVLNLFTDSGKISDSPIDILNYITKKNLQSLFPNLFIALRIFLTLPISVASGERSFSKLKLIKNYLRTSMCQERLSDLAVISIENKICEAIDHNEMINELASVKARRVML
ncbi:unnamed protein product [Diabrotica balteata]|uniref:HAT C-terminal dimerisation domain-containing protein n=1 Tax=Diabrotica balteata TaxID=107213 RepID=A0A9N9SW24_DIABA|nr:unnamed protein product [Diabrotica balteata]